MLHTEFLSVFPEGNSQNSGRKDRIMNAVYKVNALLNKMPKRVRPKVALHMDG